MEEKLTQNWPEVVTTLEMLDGEKLDIYVKSLEEIGPYRSIDDRQPPIYIGYRGSDTDLVTRLFRSYLKQFFPEFKFDVALEPVVNYLANIATGNSPKPGIILHGPVGSGKTTLLILWVRFRQRIFPKLKEGNPTDYRGRYKEADYCFYTPQRLTGLYMAHGFELFNRFHGNILILDDIGVLTEVNNFGNKTNILTEMIYGRYNAFKVNPYLEIYCTTNLLSDQLADIIGERAISRLAEMTEWKQGAIITPDRRTGKTLTRWPEIKLFDPFKEMNY